MKTSSDSLTAADYEQIEGHGLTREQVEAQLERFRKGFPAIELDRPCTVGDGILQIPAEEHETLVALHEKAAAVGRMTKFVPASGAASRMFRNLLAYYQADPDRTELTEELTRFFTLLHSFPFYEDLKEVMHRHGQDIDSVLAAQDYRLILKYLLTDAGLDYRHRPKALIPFHRDAQGARTALAEQLAEARATIQDAKQVSRLQFTVSPQFKEAIQAEVVKASAALASGGSRFEVTYSTQAAKTDTIAADLGNEPFRDSEGRLVFRPGGHGALLQNLNALGGDIIFIKNIDNVLPSSRLTEQSRYKKILGGLLAQTQERIFEWMKKLSSQSLSKETIAAARQFLEAGLGIQAPPPDPHNSAEQARLIGEILDRPLRICGVVKNVGEPGGGPFWVKGADGAVTKQLVESSQVRRSDPGQDAILSAANHFNPVDLVCGVRDHRGQPFDLTRYQDPETGLIAGKSHQGHELKALEWPGLWNGGMAHWITLFVEVPLETFAPVKTVNDLLRPEHQGSS